MGKLFSMCREKSRQEVQVTRNNVLVVWIFRYLSLKRQQAQRLLVMALCLLSGRLARCGYEKTSLPEVRSYLFAAKGGPVKRKMFRGMSESASSDRKVCGSLRASNSKCL